MTTITIVRKQRISNTYITSESPQVFKNLKSLHDHRGESGKRRQRNTKGDGGWKRWIEERHSVD